MKNNLTSKTKPFLGKEKLLNCKLCNSEFKFRNGLANHIRAVHEYSVKPEPESSLIQGVPENRSPKKEIDDSLEQLCLYECDICEKACRNAEDLEAHFKQVHKSDLAFGCNACSDRYPSEEILSMHKKCCDDVKL